MKLTAAIAASYFGAMVRTPDGDYRMHHVAPNLMCIEVETGNQFDYVAYDQCQLILTPLDKISDEDAVEVAKIAMWHPQIQDDWDNIISDFDVDEIIRQKDKMQIKYTCICDIGIFYLHHDGYACVKDENDENPHDVYKQSRYIDYLRSKGYDLGHGSIPNLIAAGVAVEKEIV